MGANMNILAWFGQALGLIPQAIEAGKKVAEAVKPGVIINERDATLWHTVTYPYEASKGGYCTVCQKVIPFGFATTLCSEAVRRRNAGLS